VKQLWSNVYVFEECRSTLGLNNFEAMLEQVRSNCELMLKQFEEGCSNIEAFLQNCLNNFAEFMKQF
jgi:hypothetical protein